MRLSLVLTFLLLAPAARAAEGMWLFNAFPAEQVEKAHGVKVDAALLERMRLGAARLGSGCSASFVSPNGLVMTNHHCVRSCIEQLSRPGRDYLARGFLARSGPQELRCPALDVSQLVGIEDVTARLQQATRGKTGEAFAKALKAEKAAIEAPCSPDAAHRCEVVTLYNGGRYHLYTYRRYEDVRLVWAPEFHMAAFGGDPDNFHFPRYGLDAAFLRVWEGGKPAQVKEALRWAQQPVKEGDLVFVAGHPGGTERLATTAQLAFQRDVALPHTLLRLSELRGVMLEFQKHNPRLASVVGARLRSVENALKALRGRHAALADPSFFASLQKADEQLRQRVSNAPRLEESTGRAWEDIARALATFSTFRQEYELFEEGEAFQSELFTHARRLLRAADELPRPSGERLREYSDAALPALRARVKSSAPVRAELEELTLAFSLRRMREQLGADDALVREVLGKDSPEALARKLVKGTRLADPRVREALLTGGKAAVEKSQDPLLLLARKVDAKARALRQRYEAEVAAPVEKASTAIADARFALLGTNVYPDATFTLRLSWGEVRGWSEPDGSKVPAHTTFGGAFARQTGVFPFRLPDTWMKAHKRLDLEVPFDIATTNDIIGGNSGSPLLNARGEVVGLIFDGNLHSLGGRYGYDAPKNRAVAVHGDAILQALERIYGAPHLAAELRGGSSASR